MPPRFRTSTDFGFRADTAVSSVVPQMTSVHTSPSVESAMEQERSAVLGGRRGRNLMKKNSRKRFWRELETYLAFWAISRPECGREGTTAMAPGRQGVDRFPSPSQSKSSRSTEGRRW